MSNPFGTALILEDGTEKNLPTKWEICDVCGGEGHTVLHGMAFTADEFYETFDEEEAHEYFHGSRYNTECECHGSGKVKVVDEEGLSPSELAMWEAQCREVRDYLSVAAQERAMGA